MPINFKNFILYYFDFLLMVISLSIFKVDSLILKGNSLFFYLFYLERDRYEESSLSEAYFFLGRVLTVEFAGLLIVAYLI